jgi:hypothetical protein
MKQEKGPWHGLWPWSLALLVLLTLGIRYAEPVRDGDLWWQMAYGRYLIENRTLVPDHTAFTWTPTLSVKVYCAWMSEIVLYLLYRVGDLPLLFAFRYMCLLIFVLAVWLRARRMGVASHPLTWLICLLGVLMSQCAAFIKPEIFSYILMTATVFLWWHIKSSGERAWRACYLFPVLMIIWVNSHGGFVFGAVFLFLVGLGETLNAFFSLKEALPPRVRRHLFIALFLSGLAILVTPYGWRYPAYLMPALWGESPEDRRFIKAYLTVLDPRASQYHYASYMLLAGSILFGLIWHNLRRRRVDWVLVLTNLAFALIYTRFLRATYFWAPIFSLSAVHLLGQRESWLWPRRRDVALGLGSVIVLVSVLVGARASFDAVCRPYEPRWFGFGISYQNPVEEADFVRTHFSNYRLGNDYDSGGYLLWALWPDTKVMIDPREFPFGEWLDRYVAFHNGREVRTFVRDFPGEVWCIRYESHALISWFLQSPDWKVAFYGPSAVVFVGRNVPLVGDRTWVGAGIAEIKSLRQALIVFGFAGTIQDWDIAHKVLASMKSRFWCPGDRSKIQTVSDWLERRLETLGR